MGYWQLLTSITTKHNLASPMAAAVAVPRFVVLLSLLGFSTVTARSSGASPATCIDLTPRPPHADASLDTNPYILEIGGLTHFNGSYYYTPGQTYTVTLRGSKSEVFRGFLVQLRSAADQSIIGGQLMLLDDDEVSSTTEIQSHMCVPSTGGFTQTSNSSKSSIAFQWTPRTGTGDVVFRYTVVQERDIHWDAASTGILRENENVTVCTNLTTVGAARISWTVTNTSVTFVVQAPSENGRYIALGFSNDRIMPKTDVIVGAVGEDTSFVDDRWSPNRTEPFLDAIQNLEAAYAILRDGNITLTFTRLLNTQDSQEDIVLTNNRDNCVYFMFAAGRANFTTNAIKYHYTNYAISMERVCLCGGSETVTSLSIWLLLLLAVVQYLL